jgi:hypothetical protein
VVDGSKAAPASSTVDAIYVEQASVFVSKEIGNVCQTYVLDAELGMLPSCLLVLRVISVLDRGSDQNDCGNCVLQLRQWKVCFQRSWKKLESTFTQKIVVKPSDFGWGAFIGEDVFEGEFISGEQLLVLRVLF